MEVHLSTAVLLLFTFLLAGLVKGLIGLGLPTVAIGLLSTAMPPGEAAALLLIPSTVTNVWQLAAGPSFRPLLRRLAGMMAGVCLGTMLGMQAGLLTGGHPGVAQSSLGAALALYAVVGLAKIRVPPPGRFERVLSPLVGLVTGAVSAATGVFVLPAVPYLGALGLSRDDLVQALGLSFTVSTLALAAGLALQGGLHTGQLGWSLASVVPALLGLAAGGWVRSRVKPAVFRACFFVGLLLLGLDLALRPLL